MRTRLILSFILLVVFFPKAHACSCSAPAGHNPWEIAERRVSGGSTVFEGKVIGLRLQWKMLEAKEGAWVPAAYFGHDPETYPHIIATIEVSRSYRGNVRKQMEVATGLGGGDCGYLFEIGTEYLVFAQVDAAGHSWTGICSGTAPLSERTAELRYLHGESAAPEDRVNFWEHAKLDKIYRTRALERTKQFGTACVQILEPTGQNDEVTLLRAHTSPTYQYERYTSERDGPRFCAKEVPSGEYLALHIKYGEPRTGPVSMTYYPGVYYRKEAKTIDVRPGETVNVAFSPLSLQTQPVSIYLYAWNLEDFATGGPFPYVFLMGLDGQPMSRPYFAEIYVSDKTKWTHVTRVQFPGVLPGRYAVWINGNFDQWSMQKRTITVADRSQSVFIRLKKDE